MHFVEISTSYGGNFRIILADFSQKLETNWIVWWIWSNRIKFNHFADELPVTSKNSAIHSRHKGLSSSNASRVLLMIVPNKLSPLQESLSQESGSSVVRPIPQTES